MKATKSEGLKNLVSVLNKKYGENAIILGVSKEEVERYNQQFISTGLLQLDIDLGGGIAIGRYTEISGKESSTKTTLALNILANAQRMGIQCALLDIEGTSGDESYLKACGVNPSTLLYMRPSSLEEATNVVNDLQNNGAVKFVIYDSIAMSMASEAELEKEVGESFRMGVPQQMIQSMLRRFQMKNNLFFRTGEVPFTLIGINQLRENIAQRYGNPEYTPGGRGKDYVSSCNIRLRTGDYIAEGTASSKIIVGQVVKYKISKNKLYKRMRDGEVNFYFDENSAGIPPLHYDVLADTVIVAVEYDVIKKSGGWYAFKDIKAQGLSNLISALKQSPETVQEIKDEVINLVQKIRKGK